MSRKAPAKKRRELTTKHRLAAACAGYVAGTLASTPLDVIKTRIQAEGGAALGVIGQVFRREGLAGFYKGLAPSLCMAPGTVVQYTLYDTLRARHLAPAAAAALAAAVDITIRTPMERIKTYRQAGLLASPVAGAGSARRVIARLWTGYGATLVRDIPYCIVYWLSYDTLRSKRFFDVDGGSSSRYTRGFLAGFAAGAIAALFATPADVVKTRIQTSGAVGLTPLAAFRLIVASGGLKALFAGLPARLVRIPVYTGIVLATFECVKFYFGTVVDDDDDAAADFD